MVGFCNAVDIRTTVSDSGFFGACFIMFVTIRWAMATTAEFLESKALALGIFCH